LARTEEGGFTTEGTENTEVEEAREAAEEEALTTKPSLRGPSGGTKSIKVEEAREAEERKDCIKNTGLGGICCVTGPRFSGG
jgi:hypothetical protein